MRPGPVLSGLRGGLTGRRMRTAVIGVVAAISAGAIVLGLALAVDSSAPFDRAFAAQRGADVTAAIDVSRAIGPDLAATARLPLVSAAAGPFATVTVAIRLGQTGGCQRPTPANPCVAAQTLPPLTLAGRGSPGGPGRRHRPASRPLDRRARPGRPVQR